MQLWERTGKPYVDKIFSNDSNWLTLEQVECYQRAVRLDQYFAVAYFQQGVSNFLTGDFEEALANFNDTLLYLRGNTYIDYDQLGLKFKLYSCEVLFNRGLCYIYLQQVEAGMADFEFAVKEKVTPDHDVIDEAIREQAEGYTVFSIPVGVVYRPNEAKVKNLKTKDYLGKARLVAASDRGNAFTGFQGSELKQMAQTSTAKDDRPTENVSFAATNLVRRDLSSRGRQQSEPPINRNMFPPTPPPDNDKPIASLSTSNTPSSNTSGGMTGRAASVRSGGPAPRALRDDLRIDVARAEAPRQQNAPEARNPAVDRPRIGTTRSASERPAGPSRGFSGRERDRDRAPRAPLYRETSGLRQQSDPEGLDAYPEDVYDMYRSPNQNPAPARRGTGRNTRPRYISEEEEEYASDADIYASPFEEEDDFDMIPASLSAARKQHRAASPSSGSGRRGPSRQGSRRPQQFELKKIRVKVHADVDTRYVMIGAAVEFRDFEERIREKFGLRRRGFRIQMRDEGDMITMGDQDDLDLALGTAKAEARRERSEMGKMEVSSKNVPILTFQRKVLRGYLQFDFRRKGTDSFIYRSGSTKHDRTTTNQPSIRDIQ